MITHSASVLKQFLTSEQDIDWSESIPICPISNPSTAIQMNSFYFGHLDWAKTYFEACHRSDEFKARWQAATGNWDGKVVVDIGCGPGNLYASVGGSPQLLIGVDISRGALEMASQIGYVPLLADAHNLPLRSGFADIVAINATLHHCEDSGQSFSL